MFVRLKGGRGRERVEVVVCAREGLVRAIMLFGLVLCVESVCDLPGWQMFSGKHFCRR